MLSEGRIYQNEEKQWLLRDKFIVSEDPDFPSEYVTGDILTAWGFSLWKAGDQPNDEEQ